MSEKKLEGLQVARAIAALSVAYFHSYIALRGFPEAAQIPIRPLTDWGYLGVNFFFAISGYVICLVAAKPTFTPATFAIKRAFRRHPMYWVAMAVIAVMIGLGRYRVESVGHFLYSTTLLPQRGAPAYDVSWTLEREVIFYLLATLIVPFAGIRGLAAALAMLAGAGDISEIRGRFTWCRQRKRIFSEALWCSCSGTKPADLELSRPSLPAVARSG